MIIIIIIIVTIVVIIIVFVVVVVAAAAAAAADVIATCVKVHSTGCLFSLCQECSWYSLCEQEWQR